MLLEFRIKNFRSIKGEQTLSMLPSSKLQERPTGLGKAQNYPKLSALRSAVVYGPNNAGKSNTLKAFDALRWMVQGSHLLNVGDKLASNESFAFDIQTQRQPTGFLIDFIGPDGLRYQYEVSFDQQKIHRENLYFFPLSESGKMTPSMLFSREMGKPISFGSYFRGQRKGVENELLDNQLFLSIAVQKRNEQLEPAYLFFREHIGIANLDNEGYDDIQLLSLGKFIYENPSSPIIDVAKKVVFGADTGILDFEVNPDSKMPKLKFPDFFPEEEREKIRQDFIERFQYEIKTTHRLFDGEREIGTSSLPLKEQSTGTKKFLNLLVPLLGALADGDLFIVDELDKSLHSAWTKVLVDLFHNPHTNPKNAQLIFSTHDPSLLDSALFARDQIYFIEKDRFGASQMYAMSSFKGIRKDIPFDRWYQSGRFGGVPVFNESQILKSVETSGIYHVEKG